MSEAEIQASARLKVGRAAHVRLFRNNRGVAWMGKIIKRAGLVVTLQQGDVLIKGARPVEFGLVNGASDLIGWTAIVVTKEMVGQQIAIFTAGECKVPGAPVPEHQQRFMDAVRLFGGRAGVIRCDDDAVQLVTKG